ncbi:MAG: hypothetical protein MRZ59_10690 [Clostridiales bacterium]|nr:hypothetical protein [Clostridiales bacterium]MDY3747056.1 hypothetical protein [Lachnospiraceae bacterium]
MKKKGKAVAKAKKKTILEYYYMIPEKTDAKALSLMIETVPEEKIEVWPQLNLMEVVMTADSLIFQDAWECFEDPLDLEYIQGHHIETIYQISYDSEDAELVKKVMKELMTKKGGLICSDTDDFEPTFNTENIGHLGEEMQ